MNTNGLSVSPCAMKARRSQMFAVIVGSVLGDSEFIPVQTVNQASEAYRAFCEVNGLGSREAGSCELRQGNKVVARVAYNGNVWAGHYPYRQEDLIFNRTGLVWNGQNWDLPKAGS